MCGLNAGVIVGSQFNINDTGAKLNIHHHDVQKSDSNRSRNVDA